MWCVQVSIPLTTMADCWRKVLEVVHEGDLSGTNATQRCARGSSLSIEVHTHGDSLKTSSCCTITKNNETKCLSGVARLSPNSVCVFSPN